jgi:Ni,Fe-hydrogenase III component G
MAKAGQGRRTVQYNPGPGAETLAEYVQAAVEHERGAHDAGGLVIHETPKERRQAFAREIWRRRRRSGR